MSDQADELRRTGAVFREIFGPDVTPQEAQRRLERAQLLQKQAEEQCERFRKELLRTAPVGPHWQLASEIFVRALEHTRGGTTSALEYTRKVLAELEALGGLP